MVYTASMTNVNHFDVPEGWKLVPAGARYTHTVSFRVTTTQALQLTALKETFTDKSWGEAFRWLLAQPIVNDLIASRVAISTLESE